MNDKLAHKWLYMKQVLQEAFDLALKNNFGEPASYIPELANAPLDALKIAVQTQDGVIESVGADLENPYYFTLQSTAKLVPLIGLLEEFGIEKLLSWINVEPSGRGFGAIDYLDRFDSIPSNPMVNAGAILLCDRIPGKSKKEKLAWINHWMEALFQNPVRINHIIYQSELETSDRNRSVAYLLKSKKILTGGVDPVLETYTALCSYETTIDVATNLPFILANHGFNAKGDRIISQETVNFTLALMATCGLYDETGYQLVRTGLPSKSGVSGLILSSAIDNAGIAVYSPRINAKGGSVRGHIVLEYLSKKMGWHFALVHQ